jgi:hypothetical protein
MHFLAAIGRKAAAAGSLSPGNSRKIRRNSRRLVDPRLDMCRFIVKNTLELIVLPGFLAGSTVKALWLVAASNLVPRIRAKGCLAARRNFLGRGASVGASRARGFASIPHGRSFHCGSSTRISAWTISAALGSCGGVRQPAEPIFIRASGCARSMHGYRSHRATCGLTSRFCHWSAFNVPATRIRHLPLRIGSALVRQGPACMARRPTSPDGRGRTFRAVRGASRPAKAPGFARVARFEWVCQSVYEKGFCAHGQEEARGWRSIPHPAKRLQPRRRGRRPIRTRRTAPNGRPVPNAIRSGSPG